MTVVLEEFPKHIDATSSGGLQEPTQFGPLMCFAAMAHIPIVSKEAAVVVMGIP